MGLNHPEFLCREPGSQPWAWDIWVVRLLGEESPVPFGGREGLEFHIQKPRSHHLSVELGFTKVSGSLQAHTAVLLISDWTGLLTLSQPIIL